MKALKDDPQQAMRELHERVMEMGCRLLERQSLPPPDFAWPIPDEKCTIRIRKPVKFSIK